MYGYLLPLLAPLVDLAFLYALLRGGDPALLALFGAFAGLQLAAAALALRLDREPPWHALVALAHQLGYRQFLSATAASSLWAALSGVPVGWGKLLRRGLSIGAA